LCDLAIKLINARNLCPVRILKIRCVYPGAISKATLIRNPGLVNFLEYNLWRGQVGTVIEILAGGEAFEVEFSDRDGRTYESVGLRRARIMALHFEPISPDLTPEIVRI
jgi:Domain of unknown function (DUF4926)